MGKALTFVIAILVVFIGWAIFYEATFDYSKCEKTNEYRDQHTAMWIQIMPRVCSGNPPICTGGYQIVHPARDWTERKYICFNEEGRFSKWREENRVSTGLAEND